MILSRTLINQVLFQQTNRCGRQVGHDMSQPGCLPDSISKHIRLKTTTIGWDVNTVRVSLIYDQYREYYWILRVEYVLARGFVSRVRETSSRVDWRSSQLETFYPQCIN